MRKIPVSTTSSNVAKLSANISHLIIETSRTEAEDSVEEVKFLEFEYFE